MSTLVARLIQVELATGTETVLVTLDSKAFPPSANYQVQSVDQCGSGTDIPLDFERNAYYVDVKLTNRVIALNSAAGVKMIKVSKANCD